jgi:hypothetical protein
VVAHEREFDQPLRLMAPVIFRLSWKWTKPPLR